MAESLEQINANCLYHATGIRLMHRDETSVSSVLNPQPAMCWPSPGQPHGGVIATQLDTTMATAVMTGPHIEASVSTIDLSIQYLAPATGPAFHCLATVQRRGRRVCFVRGETRDERGELIALGQGSFRVYLPSD